MKGYEAARDMIDAAGISLEAFMPEVRTELTGTPSILIRHIANLRREVMTKFGNFIKGNGQLVVNMYIMKVV